MYTTDASPTELAHHLYIGWDILDVERMLLSVN